MNRKTSKEIRSRDDSWKVPDLLYSFLSLKQRVHMWNIEKDFASTVIASEKSECVSQI